MDLAGSRKTYPSFVGGRINTYRSASPERADGKPPLLFSSIRGVAYKKYFPASSAPQDGGSLYTVEYDGSLYLYMDFFGGKQLTQRYSLPAGSQAELLEAAAASAGRLGRTASPLRGKRAMPSSESHSRQTEPVGPDGRPSPYQSHRSPAGSRLPICLLPGGVLYTGPCGLCVDVLYCKRFYSLSPILQLPSEVAAPFEARRPYNGRQGKEPKL